VQPFFLFGVGTAFPFPSDMPECVLPFWPCHAYKQKVWHILQAWHIASPKLFWVICMKKQAEVLPHSPVATGCFGGLSPSRTKLQAPTNCSMKHYKKVIFVQISQCQAPLHKCTAPLYKSFWWRFNCHIKLFISHFFGDNGLILTPSMSSHS